MFEVRLNLPDALKILKLDGYGDLLKLIADYFKGKFLRVEFQGPCRGEVPFNRLILGVADMDDLVPLCLYLGVNNPIWANITDRSMPEQRIQCATHPDSSLHYDTFAQVRSEMEEGAEVDHVASKRKMLVASLRLIFDMKKKASISRELEIQICSTIMQAEKALEVLYGVISAYVIMSPLSSEIHQAAKEEMKVEDIIPACTALVDRLLADIPWKEDASKLDILSYLRQYNYSVGREVA